MVRRDSELNIQSFRVRAFGVWSEGKNRDYRIPLVKVCLVPGAFYLRFPPLRRRFWETKLSEIDFAIVNSDCIFLAGQDRTAKRVRAKRTVINAFEQYLVDGGIRVEGTDVSLFLLFPKEKVRKLLNSKR